MLKIALTGGPCAGKSTILSTLTQVLEERGYKALVIPETATELILNGILPNENMSGLDFQELIIEKQISKEKIYETAAKMYGDDRVVIICDRGLCDGLAYVSKDEMELLLNKWNMTVYDALNTYDCVFHLVTAADGAEEFYEWNDPSKEGAGNNAARSESPALAREKDKMNLNSWVGHPHLRIFDNSTNFADKVSRVVKELMSVLGEPEPHEIERKFLIKKPSEEEIAALGCVSKSNIIQTYLVRKHKDTERRVRQRGTKATGYKFYYTEKTVVGSGERIETERKITPDEYVELLAEADTALHQISKVRYCFIFDNKYYEMDLYPFSDEHAILEIELNDINEPINFPPLQFVKEVTDDDAYKNCSLAKSLKLETNIKDDFVPCKHKTEGYCKYGIKTSCTSCKRNFKYYEPLVDDTKCETNCSDDDLNWIYETGREESDVLGSGSTYYDVFRTKKQRKGVRKIPRKQSYIHYSKTI